MNISFSTQFDRRSYSEYCSEIMTLFALSEYADDTRPMLITQAYMGYSACRLHMFCRNLGLMHSAFGALNKNLEKNIQ